MKRLMTITEMNDQNLNIAVARAVYTISCSLENIPKMAEHNILLLIKTMWESSVRAKEIEEVERLEGVEGKEKKVDNNGNNNNNNTNNYYNNNNSNNNYNNNNTKKSSLSSSSSSSYQPPSSSSSSSSSPIGLDRLLLATLYNLSTSTESQNKLVTDGFMDIIMTLWEIAKKDKSICMLACYSVYHMACGLTSSSRLVASGCAPILCFPWSAHALQLQEYKGFIFPLDLQLRCSMALRNLMCVVSNQESLVTAGCVDALVAIAQEAELHSTTPSTRGASFKRPTAAVITPVVPSTLSVAARKISMQSEANMKINEETRKNCAAALRCLTFNKSLRDGLYSRGAVTVLLDDLNADMKEESFPIDYNLLCKLEAESWQNGSRSRGAKEGRAPHIAPAPLNMTLLSPTHKVNLDVTVQSAILQKYRVQVHLEEPKIESGLDTFDVLNENISTLTVFENADDHGIAVTSQSEKKQWLALDLNPALSHDEILESSPQSGPRSRSKNNLHEIYSGNCGSGNNSGHGSVHKDKDKDRGNHSVSEDHNHHSHKLNFEDHSSTFLSGDRRDSHNNRESRFSVSQGHERKNEHSESRKSSHAGFPDVKSKSVNLSDIDRISGSRRSSEKLDFTALSDLPPISSSSSANGTMRSTKSKKGKIRIAPKSEDKFNNLVSFINHSRKTKGDINDVLKIWSKISK